MTFPKLDSVTLSQMARHYADTYGRARAAMFFRALADAIEGVK